MATDTLQIIIKSKATGTGSKEAEKGLGALAKAAKFAAGAFVAMRGAQAALDLVSLGAQAQRQAGALDNLARAAGTSGGAIVAAIQDASEHTIDRMAAMSAANKALVMDVAKTPEQFERLTKVAVTLGRAMGQDATKSIDDFVTAAARQSKLIADNLGLVITQSDATQAYARQLGKAADALTEAEKKQGFLNAMLVAGEAKIADLDQSVGDMATTLEQYTAAVAEARLGLAEFASDTVAGLAEVEGYWGQVFSPRNIASIGETASELLGFVKAVDEASRAASYGADFHTVLAHEVEKLQAGEEALGAATDEMTGRWRTYSVAQDEAAAAGGRLEIGMGQLAELMEDYEWRLNNVHTAEAKLPDDFYEIAEASRAAAVPMDEWRQALEDAAEAAEAAAVAQSGLAQQLADASGAQMAQAAISQLKVSLDEGSISLEEYELAVGEVQLAFGLATPGSMALASNITLLTGALGSGKIGADEYAASLRLLVLQAGEMDAALSFVSDLARASGEAIGEGARTVAYESELAAVAAAQMANEVQNAAAVTGDYFVAALGDATDETNVWAIALFEAADAAGADSNELAALAGTLGIYTEAEIQAALATAAMRITLDELAKAIAGEALTMEAAIVIFNEALALMPEQIDLMDQQAAASNAVRTARSAQTVAEREAVRVARELERAQALTGDYLTEHLRELEMATEGVDEWSVALYKAADAAGADSTELAMLAGALGLFTEEQLASALAMAAMQEKMAQLGKQIAGGMDIEKAMRQLTQFRESILGESIPAFQGGTPYYPGGRAWVGERGPELVTIPRGSRIDGAAQSQVITNNNQRTMNVSLAAGDNRQQIGALMDAVGGGLAGRM